MALLGVFAPVIIQLVTRYVPGSTLRFIVALVLAGLTGFAAMLWAKIPMQFTPEWIGIWYSAANIAYMLVWKPLSKAYGVLERKVE